MRWMLAFIILAASTMLTPFGELKCQAEITPTVDPKNSRVVTLKDFPDTNPTFNPPRTHTIHLYLPADYATTKDNYPVFYFHDGAEIIGVDHLNQGTINVVFLDVIYDQLIAKNLIKPAILVQVEPSAIKRNVELTPKNIKGKPRFGGGGGGVDDYYNFLATQLKPYIDTHYRTKSDPANTGVGGCSLGGLATLYTGYNHPETFGMAACLSPSLWWDEESLVDQIQKDTAPKTATRFWFNVGSDEGADMWQPAMRAAASLKRRGWVEGTEVALRFNYQGLHEYNAWTAQAADMFQFFLGKKTPALSHIAIKHLRDFEGRPIYLDAVRELPYATLELQYVGGYRLNAISPEFTTDTPEYFALDNFPYNKVLNKDRGLGMLRASYGGLTAEQLVVGYTPDLPLTKVTYPCPVVKTPLDIHAPLSRWPERTYALDLSSAKAQFQPTVAKDPATMPASAKGGKLGVWHDDKFLYVAVEVNKKPIVASPDIEPWGQDGVELRIDARPDDVRNYGKGDGEFQKILLLAASPNPQDPELPAIYNNGSFPVGTKVACRTTETGYVLLAAIPATYLNAQQRTQKSPTWKAVRINVDVNTQETPKGSVGKHWWQPDWRTPENIPGSGTFERIDPVPTNPATTSSNK